MAGVRERVAALARQVVERLFLRTSLRLGLTVTPKGDKRLRVEVDPRLTLPGLYEASARALGGTPRLAAAAHVRKVAGNFLDAQKEAAVAAVTRTMHVVAGLSEAPSAADAKDAVRKAMTRIMTRLEGAVERVVDSEATAARNLGGLDAVVGMAHAAGVEDPAVYFVVVNDDKLCRECKRLHLNEDGVTPRVWRLSQVSGEYHERGDAAPSVMGLHPHCRCTMVYLAPGYGFVGGRASFVALDHDELAKQRG